MVWLLLIIVALVVGYVVGEKVGYNNAIDYIYGERRSEWDDE